MTKVDDNYGLTHSTRMNVYVPSRLTRLDRTFFERNSSFYFSSFQYDGNNTWTQLIIIYFIVMVFFYVTFTYVF